MHVRQIPCHTGNCFINRILWNCLWISNKCFLACACNVNLWSTMTITVTIFAQMAIMKSWGFGLIHFYLTTACNIIMLSYWYKQKGLHLRTRLECTMMHVWWTVNNSGNTNILQMTDTDSNIFQAHYVLYWKHFYQWYIYKL